MSNLKHENIPFSNFCFCENLNLPINEHCFQLNINSNLSQQFSNKIKDFNPSAEIIYQCKSIHFENSNQLCVHIEILNPDDTSSCQKEKLLEEFYSLLSNLQNSLFQPQNSTTSPKILISEVVEEQKVEEISENNIGYQIVLRKDINSMK